MIQLPSIREIRDGLKEPKEIQDDKELMVDLIKKLNGPTTIEGKADLLKKLIETSSRIDVKLAQLTIENQDDHVLNKAIVVNMKSQALAMSMLKSLTNTWTNKQLTDSFSEKNLLQKQQEKFTASRMPALSHPLTDQDREFDRESGVEYLSDELKREAYRVFLDNGVIKQFVCVGEGDDAHIILQNFDTHGMTSGDKQNACIFVISREGKIYAANTEFEKFHHSSFLAGDTVAFAGSMKVEDGIIKYLDNSSGHYRPPAQATVVLSEMLAKSDAVNASTMVRTWDRQR